MIKPFSHTAWLTVIFSPFIAQILVAPSALARQEADYLNLSVEQLFNATVVSATKTEEKWWTTPAAVYVLSSEDIIRSGAKSVPEALRMVPGVQVARNGTSSWAISVRGFNGSLSNKLLVLIDGREVYDPLFSGVYWDIQDTMLEDIERIEVIRGPGGTLWGSNAVNGIISIITKQAKDTQGNLVSLTAGNQERAIVAARHGGKFSNGHYRTYAKTLYRDGQRALGGGDSIDSWRAQRGGFRMDWNQSDTDSYNMQGEVYNSETSQNGRVPMLTAPYSMAVDAETEAQGGHLIGNWARSYSADERLAFKTYLNYSTRDQLALKDRRLTFDADLQYQFLAGNAHAMVVGGKYRLSADKLTPTASVTFDDAERTDNTFSAFVQDKIALVPEEWYLTLGSKFEHNDYTGFEFQPNARLQWHPADDKMVWTSVSRAVRIPSRFEHDFDLLAGVTAPQTPGSLPSTFEFLASPDMGSEELIAYELGYRHELTPTLMLDVATFYNDYDSLTTFHFDPVSLTHRPGFASLILRATNETSGEGYGGEMAINWRARENLNLSTAYSYLKLNLDGPSSTVAIDPKAAERDSPQHQFNIRSQWDVTKKLHLDSAFYYVSSLGGSQQVDDYTRFDVWLGWKINDRLQFNIVGQNLFDDAHREFLSPTNANAVEIRRSIYGNIVWNF